MENIKELESKIDNIIEELNEPVYRAEILTAKSKLIELKKALNIMTDKEIELTAEVKRLKEQLHIDSVIKCKRI